MHIGVPGQSKAAVGIVTVVIKVGHRIAYRSTFVCRRVISVFGKYRNGGIAAIGTAHYSRRILIILVDKGDVVPEIKVVGQVIVSCSGGKRTCRDSFHK